MIDTEETRREKFNNEKIRSITLSGIGFVSAEKDQPIEEFLVNGEMASIKWFRKGKQEFNGKYVIRIEYF